MAAAAVLNKSKNCHISSDSGTSKTCFGRGMHCPSASSYIPIYDRPAQQMRILYFAPAVTFFLSWFSSPNLSGRRLDAYHTSTHAV